MSIRLATTFPSSVLPNNGSYSDQIAGLDGILAWWRSGDNEALDGSNALQAWGSKVTAINGYGGSAGARPLPTVGAIGGQRGIVFDGVNDIVALTNVGNRTSAFSWVMICQMAAPSGAEAWPASTFQAIGTGSFIKASLDGKVWWGHGNGAASAPLVAGAPMIVIGGYSNYYISGRVNGIDMVRTASNNSEGVQTITLGAATGGALLPAAVTIADFMTFQRDLTLDGAAVALLEGYARDVYGAVIT